MNHDHEIDTDDWVLIVEALATWDVHRDLDDDRALRARELSSRIARRHGYAWPSEFVFDSL